MWNILLTTHYVRVLVKLVQRSDTRYMFCMYNEQGSLGSLKDTPLPVGIATNLSAHALLYGFSRQLAQGVGGNPASRPRGQGGYLPGGLDGGPV